MTEFSGKEQVGNACPLKGTYVLLQVTDTGSGINDEVKKHIFDPFFTTKPEDQGTGLGLATVNELVTRNHGYISVDSIPGTRTTFNIYLPMYRKGFKIRGDEKMPQASELKISD
jgi:signal transduction histidine kinase